ncbi:alpha/beta hydrolase [Tahibacter caeni]|uniref:alpha/beta hydrolase n=1 Tax=Tahibacter caeni TaxID=1453545 RepID=UPI0021488AA2|nr:alpha/beta hydrolase [Tahibacter caeni]
MLQRLSCSLAFVAAAFVFAAPPLPADEAAPRILVGEQAGASWRIDVPANWNGSLLVFFRGNSAQKERYDTTPYTAGGRRIMLQRGFALAQSGYARADWNIADAYADTEWVRRHFNATIGKPKHTYAIGQSMGGLGVAYALERRDTPYDGGLSLAGTLGGGDALFEQAFVQLAAFDHYLPGVIGPLAPVPSAQALDAAAVRALDAAVQASPDAAKRLAALMSVPVEQIGEQTAINRDLVRRLQQLAGGNAVGNANWLYSGSGDDAALNAGVRRYAADARAFEFLKRNYVPSGQLAKPLLALQTVHDPIVSAAATNSYASAVQRAGRSAQFVQQYVPGEQHLGFEVGQIVAAIDALRGWVERGERPFSGMQPPAAAVEGGIAAPAAATAPSEPMPEHATFTLDSAALKETRRIAVYTPPGYAADAAARYPLLVMPDGGVAEDFPHVATVVDRAIRAGQMPALVLVGIENTERRRDMTGPTEVESDRKIAPRVGGSAAFRAFVRDELLPQVAARYRVSDERAIVGESLAGLFVLETCVEEPQLFRTCIALSPSVWWNRGALVRALPARLKARPDWHARWYVATAGDDETPESAALIETLRADAPAGLQWQYEPRPDLRHDNIYRSLAPAVLPKLLQP